MGTRIIDTINLLNGMEVVHTKQITLNGMAVDSASGTSCSRGSERTSTSCSRGSERTSTSCSRGSERTSTSTSDTTASNIVKLCNGRKVDTTTANGLTAAVLDNLNHNGKFAWRNNVVALKGRPAQNAGSPDIIACFDGLLVGIEIKVGRDYQRPVQAAWQERLQRAGGAYYVVRTYDEYKSIYKLIAEQVNTRAAVEELCNVLRTGGKASSYIIECSSSNNRINIELYERK